MSEAREFTGGRRHRSDPVRRSLTPLARSLGPVRPVGGKSERMSRSMRGPRWKLLRPFLIPQLFLGGRDQFVRLEAELFLELLERRRSAERLHADDAPRLTDVALPSQGRSEERRVGKSCT